MKILFILALILCSCTFFVNENRRNFKYKRYLSPTLYRMIPQLSIQTAENTEEYIYSDGTTIKYGFQPFPWGQTKPKEIDPPPKHFNFRFNIPKPVSINCYRTGQENLLIKTYLNEIGYDIKDTSQFDKVFYDIYTLIRLEMKEYHLSKDGWEYESSTDLMKSIDSYEYRYKPLEKYVNIKYMHYKLSHSLLDLATKVDKKHFILGLIEQKNYPRVKYFKKIELVKYDYKKLFSQDSFSDSYTKEIFNDVYMIENKHRNNFNDYLKVLNNLDCQIININDHDEIKLQERKKFYNKHVRDIRDGWIFPQYMDSKLS